MPREFKDYIIDQRKVQDALLEVLEANPTYNITKGPKNKAEFNDDHRRKYAIGLYLSYINWLIDTYDANHSSNDTPPITTSFLLLQLEVILDYNQKVCATPRNNDDRADEPLLLNVDKIPGQERITEIQHKIDPIITRSLAQTHHELRNHFKKWGPRPLALSSLIFTASLCAVLMIPTPIHTALIFLLAFSTLMSGIGIVASTYKTARYIDLNRGIVYADLKNTHEYTIQRDLVARHSRHIEKYSYSTAVKNTLLIATRAWAPSTERCESYDATNNLGNVKFEKKDLQDLSTTLKYYA